MNGPSILSRKLRMDAKENAGTDASRIVELLTQFPNPNAIWSAFRAGIIDEETAQKLIPDETADQTGFFRAVIKKKPNR